MCVGHTCTEHQFLSPHKLLINITIGAGYSAKSKLQRLSDIVQLCTFNQTKMAGFTLFGINMGYSDKKF